MKRLIPGKFSLSCTKVVLYADTGCFASVSCSTKNLAFMWGLNMRSRHRGNTSRDLRFIINYDCIGLFVGNGVILVHV